MAGERPVHALRDPDGEALNTTRKDTHINRFDDHVHVIRLHAELQNA